MSQPTTFLARFLPRMTFAALVATTMQMGCATGELGTEPPIEDPGKGDQGGQGGQDGSPSDQFSFRTKAERTERLPGENAFWTAMLSGGSYAAEPELKIALAKIGIDVSKPGNEFKFFEVKRTSTEAFYLATADAAFLVFRGTLEAQDWLTDFNKGPLSGAIPGAKVHLGYAGQIDSIWREGKLREFLLQRHGARAGQNQKPLYIAGHSMGGALATFATYLALFDGCNQVPGWAQGSSIDANAPCMSNYIPVEALYTFGQPLVANAPFATAFAQRLDTTKTAYFRFANAEDGVPAFPEGIGFTHVSHAGNANDYLVGLTRAGRLTIGQNPKGIDDRPANSPDEKCGDRSGNDHSIATYASKIRAYAKGTAWAPTIKCQ